MGMTYEQFWDESPYIAVAYRKAYRLKQELENERAWLQGLYNYCAFATCLNNAFSKNRKQNYIERPADIFPASEKEKKRREAEEYAKMQKAMEQMQRQQRKKNKKGE